MSRLNVVAQNKKVIFNLFDIDSPGMSCSADTANASQKAR